METKKRNRLNVEKKREIVEYFRTFLFKNISLTIVDFVTSFESHKITVGMLNRWNNEYALGWYDVELNSIYVNNCYSHVGCIADILKKINRKLSLKFPKESEIMEVNYSKDLGYGVIAKKDLSINTSLGCYLGTKIQLNNDRCVFCLREKQKGELGDDYSKGFLGIDAKSFLSCYGRYLNHPPIDKKVNVISYIEKGQIHLKTCCKVKRGEEFYCSYGYKYWEEKAKNASYKQKKTFLQLSKRK